MKLSGARIVVPFLLSLALPFTKARAELSDWQKTERETASAEALKDLRSRDLAYVPYATWVRLSHGGSIYDFARRLLMGRYTPGVDVGFRFQEWGGYASVNYDLLFDFSQEIRALHVLRYGIGAEMLSMGGHIRSSAGFGLTRLLSATDLDPAGTNGYYLTLNPVSLRWKTGWTDTLVFEIVPWEMQGLALVTTGLPLVVSNWVTQFSFEWSF